MYQGSKYRGDKMVETKKIIVFTLEETDFGFPIEQVSEIIKYIPVTDIPNSLPYVEGACNIRGTIHVILNLKKILKMSKENVNHKSYIIIAEEFDAGVIVDEVKMIVTPTPDDIVLMDSLQKSIYNKDIMYVVKSEGKLIYVLNLRNILSRIIKDVV